MSSDESLFVVFNFSKENLRFVRVTDKDPVLGSNESAFIVMRRDLPAQTENRIYYVEHEKEETEKLCLAAFEEGFHYIGT